MIRESFHQFESYQVPVYGHSCVKRECPFWFAAPVRDQEPGHGLTLSSVTARVVHMQHASFGLLNTAASWIALPGHERPTADQSKFRAGDHRGPSDDGLLSFRALFDH